jgi:hypothetical protein
LKGLFLDLYFLSTLAQFTGVEIDLKSTETGDSIGYDLIRTIS